MAYFMDLTHYLDSEGNIPKALPKESRQMASFLALIVGEVTTQFPQVTRSIETGIRCLEEKCHGEIVCALDNADSPIRWYCLECGGLGIINNWQASQWDNTEGRAEPPA